MAASMRARSRQTFSLILDLNQRILPRMVVAAVNQIGEFWEKMS